MMQACRFSGGGLALAASAALVVAAAGCSGAGPADAAAPGEPAGVTGPGRIYASLDEPAGAAIDPHAHYLFYLHGAIIERGDRRPTHPRYGVYEYDAILRRFADAGLVVIGEQRGPVTDLRQYAGRVAAAVQRLIDAGVPGRQITVAGFSKGSGIELWVSDLVHDPDVGHVLMAACSRPYTEPPPFALHGRVLSIYEASDEIGRSCASLEGTSPELTSFREVQIAIGGEHGAFYRPHPEWIDEVLQWSGAEKGTGTF